MRKILLLLSLLLLCLPDSVAQCSDVIKTTTPTVNVWDWRTRYWVVTYKTTSGLATTYNMDSPFYDTQFNKNIEKLADKDDANKDFKIEDGWELIKKDLGSSNQPSTNPFVVLYNKNTSKLRVFFLVIQLYSEIGSTDEAKGGLIKVGFTNGASDITYAYQSNLFSANTTPVSPLEQFTRDLAISTPNLFRSNLPYWLYADVPVMYDPCTCQNKGKLFIQAQLINTATVDITINSLPYQSPVSNNAVNRNTDFLTAFTNIGDQVSGGLKAVNSVADATGKLVDGLDKVIDPDNQDLKYFYTRAISTFSDNVNSTGNFLELLPLVGGAAKSVVSLIDFFVSGGKKSGGAAPSSVIILNDFKAKGSITQVIPKNNITISIPGSDETGLASTFIPTYNNVLGIFNLLETPVINGKIYRQYNSRGGRRGELLLDQLGEIATYQLARPLQYVINPALDIDYTVSDINATLVFDKSKNLNPRAGGFASNLQQETSSKYRTSYYPISCINSVIVKSYFGTYQAPRAGTFYYNFFGNGVTPQNVVLKITARLRKRNATNPNEDIVFVSTFPTKFNDLGPVNFINTTLPNDLAVENFEDIYEEDVVINGKFDFNTTVKCLRNITIGNVWIKQGVRVDFQAGGTITGQPVYRYTTGPSGTPIIYNGTYTFTPNRSTFPLPNACSVKKAPESPTAINTFCNSSTYKVTKRYSAARIGNEEEEILASPAPTTLLHGVSPNPVSQVASIKYSLAENTQVYIYIINALGNRVSLIEDSFQEAGEHEAELDVNTLVNGIYLCTLETGAVKQTKRIVVIK